MVEVVALFNAISKSKRDAAETADAPPSSSSASKTDIKNKKRKDVKKDVQKMTKDLFLDSMLTDVRHKDKASDSAAVAEDASIATTDAAAAAKGKAVEKEKWSVLRDDFLQGSMAMKVCKLMF